MTEKTDRAFSYVNKYFDKAVRKYKLSAAEEYDLTFMLATMCDNLLTPTQLKPQGDLLFTQCTKPN